MEVSQIDARTVRVQTPAAAFRLPYRLWWNGHERRPESIVTRATGRGGDVRAFFLFATVRDLIEPAADGVTIRRSWSIASPEPARLSVDVAFERGGEAGWLLPGVAMGTGLSEAGMQAIGARTSIPSSACLFFGGDGIIGWVVESSAPTRIGALRAPGEEDEGALACLQARLDGPAPQSATLEASCTFRVLFAPASRTVLRGLAASVAGPVAASGRRQPSDLDAIRSGVERCLATHLVQDGGVAGLREVPAGGVLSAEAGAGMAALLRRLFPGEPAQAELALRLADFVLKGQHPSGLFFEGFDVRRARWSGAPGRAPEPVVSTAASARVAGSLLALADLLEADGRPADKYRIASQRFVDFFFDEQGSFQLPGALHRPGERVPAEAGLAGMELFFPLARTWRRTGRDRYRKALAALSRELERLPWGTPWLPASREGRDPDAAAALLCARIVAAAHGLKLEPVSGEAAAAALAPWVYVGSREAVEDIDPAGALIDSFHRQRLICAGAECALALRGLQGLSQDVRWLERALDGLARLCRSSATRVPLGTAWLLHAVEPAPPGSRPPRSPPSRVGPIDSRRLVREASALLDLAGSPRRSTHA